MASAAYGRELASYGLVDARLGVEHVFDSSAAVVFGIFTSLLFARVETSVSRHRLQQYTLIAAAFTVAIFALIRAFVKSALSRALRGYSREYWRLLMQVAQFVRHSTLFLLTHFLSSMFIKLWSELQMSAAESFDAMWRTFVAIYFVVQIVKKRAKMPADDAGVR